MVKYKFCNVLEDMLPPYSESKSKLCRKEARSRWQGCHLLLSGFWTLRMEAVCFYEMLITTYQTTWHRSQKYHKYHEKFRSYIIQYSSVTNKLFLIFKSENKIKNVVFWVVMPHISDQAQVAICFCSLLSWVPLVLEDGGNMFL